jgi:hypothetical protein
MSLRYGQLLCLVYMNFQLCSNIVFFSNENLHIHSCALSQYTQKKTLPVLGKILLSFVKVNLASEGHEYNDLILTQNMEKEKYQLESAAKRFMHDLEEVKGQQIMLSKQIAHLEKLLNEKR